jgi:hypothetical protein
MEVTDGSLLFSDPRDPLVFKTSLLDGASGGFVTELLINAVDAYLFRTKPGFESKTSSFGFGLNKLTDLGINR